MMKFWPLLILSIFAAFSGFAEEKKVEEEKAEEKLLLKLVCHGPNDERSLEIVAKGRGCVLNYTKHNVTKEVARGNFSQTPCHTTMKNVRDNLESGNFACE